MNKRLFLIGLVVIFWLPFLTQATVGVGVGTGKIEFKEPIKAGGIYTLPPISVFNNGDETATYTMYINWLQDQKQLKPDRSWIEFSPQEFTMSPGKGQAVDVKMSLPLKVVPGDYFAYLVAKPIKGAAPGEVGIGVAAASKLYFTVKPANIFQGVYYRLASLLVRGAPWTYIVIGVIILAIFLKFVGRFISVDIGIRKKK